MIALRQFFTLVAAALEAFGVYCAWVFCYYTWREYVTPPGTMRDEAGLGQVLAALYGLPAIALSALLFWMLWASLERGKLIGRRLPLLLGVSVFVGMFVLVGIWNLRHA